MKIRKTTTSAYAANKTVKNEVNRNTPGPVTLMEDEASRIAAIAFESFIKNREALCMAYYASHPCTSDKMLRLPKGDARRCAAETARALHNKPVRVRQMAAAGYFEAQLHNLLEIAKKNSDYGAKLVQVFVYMIVHQQEHRLSEAIVDEMKKFVGMHDSHDGFILIAENPDECVVMYAV